MSFVETRVARRRGINHGPPVTSISILQRLRSVLSSDSLKARCACGGAALAAGTVVARGARFVRNMILARILAPDQFGLMALVMAAGGLFEVLTEVGVREAVVQNKRGDSKEFLNVAWWFSAVRGVLLYVIGLASVPWIADVYREPLLNSLLQVSFLTMLFSGLTSTRLYALQKNLQFGWYALITQGSGLAGTLISLVAVWFTPNVWALVTGLVAEAVIRCLASFILCPIRPTFAFDRQCSRELFAFARGMFGLPILTFVVMSADVFVLGKVCTKNQVGMYSMALAFAQIPMMLFSRVVQPMVLPVFSAHQYDLSQLRAMVLDSTRLILLFGLPIAACCAVFSSDLLTVVYGRQYVVVSGAMVLLALYVPLYLTATLVASTYFAVGCPRLHRRFTIIRAILMAVVIYPACSRFGPTGAAASLLGCYVVASLFQLLNLGRLLSFSLRRYCVGAVEGLFLAGAVSLPAGCVQLFSNWSAFTSVICCVVLCIAAWALGTMRIRSRFRDVGSAALRVSAVSTS